jgi:hypothetical protein
MAATFLAVFLIVAACGDRERPPDASELYGDAGGPSNFGGRPASNHGGAGGNTSGSSGSASEAGESSEAGASGSAGSRGASGGDSGAGGSGGLPTGTCAAGVVNNSACSDEGPCTLGVGLAGEASERLLACQCVDNSWSCTFVECPNVCSHEIGSCPNVDPTETCWCYTITTPPDTVGNCCCVPP